jgi:hypothetical protein
MDSFASDLYIMNCVPYVKESRNSKSNWTKIVLQRIISRETI